MLFSIGKALRAKGNKVIYFAGYKKAEPTSSSWTTSRSRPMSSSGARTSPRRCSPGGLRIEVSSATSSRRCSPTARESWAKRRFTLRGADRIIAIGSDRMMAAVSLARHTVLKPYFKESHVAIGSINSPMQCMMKEVCAQCLQRQVDPKTGAQLEPVFTCYNQDQKMDEVDFPNLNARLKQNSVQEKLTNLWLDYLLKKKALPRV
ncbi:MAG: hypothetical protein MPW15_08260 [Candidatus Manganitrophus sp.]|nr:hypothetical protein [Candidatus Manganitrophus sp.]